MARVAQQRGETQIPGGIIAVGAGFKEVSCELVLTDVHQHFAGGVRGLLVDGVAVGALVGFGESGLRSVQHGLGCGDERGGLGIESQCRLDGLLGLAAVEE